MIRAQFRCSVGTGQKIKRSASAGAVCYAVPRSGHADCALPFAVCVIGIHCLPDVDNAAGLHWEKLPYPNLRWFEGTSLPRSCTLRSTA